MPTDQVDRLWKPTVASQVGGGVLVAVGVIAVVGGLGAAVVAAARSDTDAVLGAFAVAGIFGPLALLGWRLGIYPYIAATDADVLVRSPFRSILIPWNEIVGCSPGYDGLTIRRHEREPVVAWAVQKANASQWAGRTVRADQVAAYIEARANGLF